MNPQNTPTPQHNTTRHVANCKTNGGHVPPSQCPKCSQPPDYKLMGYLMKLDRLAGKRAGGR
ncbi:hypothetical protein FE374_09315 [Georgenia yuyongxinii]|uniref:Uncharacterized protein n=1 Tax=Georgenia yuyongxinii TaxID=2589797 RepID=A0A5B8C2H1_9MICO|nr:hypothetical protein [Georgenia yuyongxinii]QDC24783.1 hypothetical protein FE374_09315 [Georgenia yuyongxinii]